MVYKWFFIRSIYFYCMIGFKSMPTSAAGHIPTIPGARKKAPKEAAPPQRLRNFPAEMATLGFLIHVYKLF